jgi:hypothetical protein
VDGVRFRIQLEQMFAAKHHLAGRFFVEQREAIRRPR